MYCALRMKETFVSVKNIDKYAIEIMEIDFEDFSLSNFKANRKLSWSQLLSREN